MQVQPPVHSNQLWILLRGFAFRGYVLPLFLLVLLNEARPMVVG